MATEMMIAQITGNKKGLKIKKQMYMIKKTNAVFIAVSIPLELLMF